MGKKLQAGHRTLKGYEGTNLLFFFCIILILGGFVAIVFQFYRGAMKPSSSSMHPGVISESVIPGTEACMFYVGTRMSESNRRYVGPQDIPATDDGLVRDLFAVPGVTEVVVDHTMVMLHKSPSAQWEKIQPGAREVINKHLHMHQ